MERPDRAFRGIRRHQWTVPARSSDRANSERSRPNGPHPRACGATLLRLRGEGLHLAWNESAAMRAIDGTPGWKEPALTLGLHAITLSAQSERVAAHRRRSEARSGSPTRIPYPKA